LALDAFVALLFVVLVVLLMMVHRVFLRGAGSRRLQPVACLLGIMLAKAQAKACGYHVVLSSRERAMCGRVS
jgi:hypothetical protein